MILYLDASALVKRYTVELGSADVAAIIACCDIIGTALICRAEVAAAFAKATRTRALAYSEALASLQAFRREWATFVRLQLTEQVVARSDAWAWEYGLRGCAVHEFCTANPQMRGCAYPCIRGDHSWTAFCLTPRPQTVPSAPFVPSSPARPA